MIHIKYRNKWERQERLMSFTTHEELDKFYDDKKMIIMDYTECGSENPFHIWKKDNGVTWYSDMSFGTESIPNSSDHYFGYQRQSSTIVRCRVSNTSNYADSDIMWLR